MGCKAVRLLMWSLNLMDYLMYFLLLSSYFFLRWTDNGCHRILVSAAIPLIGSLILLGLNWGRAWGVWGQGLTIVLCKVGSGCWVIAECSYKISNRPCHTLPFALPYIAIALPQWGHNTGIWIHSDCNQLNRNSELLEFRREILSRTERFFGEIGNCTIASEKMGPEKENIETALLLSDDIL